jgi:hypothetical protein
VPIVPEIWLARVAVKHHCAGQAEELVVNRFALHAVFEPARETVREAVRRLDLDVSIK